MARIFGIRILSIWMAALLLLTACDDASNQENAARSAPPPEVGVVELQPRRVTLSMELPGRTSAYRIAEVRPQVTGILQERLFRQGAQVNAGDVLFQIDPNRYRAAYERAQAELERAQAELRQAEREWTRASRLFETNAVSESQRDAALSALEGARADVSRSEAMAETARIDLEYTEVKAPVSGRTGPTLSTVGALLTANQAQPLARVVQLDPMYVDIQLPVEKLRRIRSSLKEGVTSKAGPDQAEVVLLREDGAVYPHRGRVDVTDVTVNQSTSSVTLRSVFPNPDEDLLPGMYVRVRLSEGVRENALLAPQQGITRNPQGEATALLVTAEDEVVERQLETARAIGAFWLVEKGLEPGDRLIVSGLQNVSPGAKVKPVTADIPLQPDSSRQTSTTESSKTGSSKEEDPAR